MSSMTRTSEVDISAPGIAALLACIAAGLAAGRIVHSPAALIAGIVVGLYLLFSIKVVQQWQRVAILRFGRYRGLRGPGLFLIVPVVDTLSRFVDQRVRVAGHVSTGFCGCTTGRAGCSGSGRKQSFGGVSRQTR